MKCPVCRAPYRPSRSASPVCRRCGTELSPLIHLHDQALWHHRQAIESFKVGDYAGATAQNNQALALHYNHPDFQALAGQLWALQGEFPRAIATWKKAQQMNPQHPPEGLNLFLSFFAETGKLLRDKQ